MQTVTSPAGSSQELPINMGLSSGGSTREANIRMRRTRRSRPSPLFKDSQLIEKVLTHFAAKGPAVEASRLPPCSVDEPSVAGASDLDERAMKTLMAELIAWIAKRSGMWAWPPPEVCFVADREIAE